MNNRVAIITIIKYTSNWFMNDPTHECISLLGICVLLWCYRYLQAIENKTELIFGIVDGNTAAVNNSSLLEFNFGKNATSQLNALLNALLYVAPEKFKAGNGSSAFDALMSFFPGTSTMSGFV